MRIMWFALLLGPIGFWGVLVFFGLPNSPQTMQPRPALTWASIGLLVTAVPVAFFIRRSIFRRSRVDGHIPPAAYSTGNIVFWDVCEFCAFFALLVVMVNRSTWPTIVVAAIALCLVAITFPSGPDLTLSTDVESSQAPVK